MNTIRIEYIGDKKNLCFWELFWFSDKNLRLVIKNSFQVWSCYRVSITSNQADKKLFIRSKNNNEIAGIAESVKPKKAEFSALKA